MVTLFMTLFKLFGTIKTLFKLFKPEGRKIQDDKKTVKKGGNGNILEMLEQGNQEDRIL